MTVHEELQYELYRLQGHIDAYLKDNADAIAPCVDCGEQIYWLFSDRQKKLLAYTADLQRHSVICRGKRAG